MTQNSEGKLTAADSTKTQQLLSDEVKAEKDVTYRCNAALQGHVLSVPLQVATFGKLFTHARARARARASVTKQYNLVVVKRR